MAALSLYEVNDLTMELVIILPLSTFGVLRCFGPPLCNDTEVPAVLHSVSHLPDSEKALGPRLELNNDTAWQRSIHKIVLYQMKAT
jgi:hypothetical protein